ncbi:unnamed protein product [Coregonus sp. 'balchen']|nr:unnamed protein product [Coregonus sp. 'balchen']
MKKGNWRDRDRRRHGYRSDWQRDRTQEQRYGSSEAGPSYRDRTPESRPSPAAAASSSSSSSAPELPGFYFDAEKNRYFRLLPGHNNCNPLTRGLLQEREQEKHRARMITEDERPRKKAPRAGLNSALLLQKRHLGLLPGVSYCRRIHEVKVSGMRRHRLEVQSSDSSSPNTDNFRLIVGDSACERVFTVNDVSHGGCKYGIMNFRGCSRGSLSVEILCLVGMAETPGCVSLLPASLFSNSNPDQPGMLCSFKISTAWSCAWCLNPQADKTFSTGLSRRVIVTDAVTGRRQTYGIGSDVLAQQFALRIKLWDVRVTKPVQKYEGHHNEHAYLPLHINEPEGLLMAVGQDCYTRLWSLGDGKLLRTIPSPHPAGKDLIPSVVFSSQLGGSRGLPGLLMAVRHDLYYFPYNSDYQEGGGVVAEAAC